MVKYVAVNYNCRNPLTAKLKIRSRHVSWRSYHSFSKLFHYIIHVCVMFFTITFDIVFGFLLHVCVMHLCFFNCTFHVSFVSLHVCIMYLVSVLHVCAMFLTIIPAANADFLPNFFKINCHIGIDAIEETLWEKNPEKISNSSLLNKNINHRLFTFTMYLKFTYFKVCQIQSALWNVVCKVRDLRLNYIYHRESWVRYLPVKWWWIRKNRLPDLDYECKIGPNFLEQSSK